MGNAFCSANNIKEIDTKKVFSNSKQNNEKINIKKDLYFLNNPFEYNNFLKKLYLQNTNDLTIYKNNIKFLADKIKNFSIKDNFDYYQCLSCILGAFYGDALGNNVEFEPKNPNNHNLIYGRNKYKFILPGEITDDSEMAISLAFAILDNNDLYNLNQNLLYFYYGAWGKTNSIDIGLATSTALQDFDFKYMINDKNLYSYEIKNKIIEKNKDSKANGFLMRISTLVVWFYFRFKDFLKNNLDKNDINLFYEIYKKIYEQVSKDTTIIHPNPENSVAATIFVFMSLCSIFKYNHNQILEKLKILINNENFLNYTDSDKTVVKNLILNTLKSFEDKNFDKDKFFDIVTKQGYYGHAYKLTLYYLYIFDKIPETNNISKYRYIMNEICDFGGDADTNCAIVGTVIGPLIGYNNFDKEDFDTFLYHVNVEKGRSHFTTSYMYLYIKYLDITNKEANKKNINGNDIRYNVGKLFTTLLYEEINDKIIENMFN